MWVMAIYNIKGGVGKTTSTVNLAYAASREGKRVLVWDLDAQGAASFYFRVKPKIKGGLKKLIRRKDRLEKSIKETNYDNIDLIPADFSNRNMDVLLADSKHAKQRLNKLLSPVEDDYDFILLDCPPSLSMTSENVFLAADILLVPLIPTYLSVRAYQQLKTYQNEKNNFALQLMPFFSMVDRRRRLHREIVEQFYKDNPEVLKIFISYSSQVELMGKHLAPLQTYAASTFVSKSFQLLWHEIRTRLES
jgi:chromosome partitioning protein